MFFDPDISTSLCHQMKEGGAVKKTLNRITILFNLSLDNTKKKKTFFFIYRPHLFFSLLFILLFYKKMIEAAITNFDNNNTKKPLRIKSIFRETYGRKPINRLEISPPILQHSTSIFSLVSPTRSHHFNDLYHPLASPPPIPSNNNLCKKTNARYTLASDPREHSRKKSTSSNCKPMPARRHSYSSTPIYKTPESKQQQQQPIKELKYVKSIRSSCNKTLPERRRSSISQRSSTVSSSAAASIIITPTVSKSTPSRKVKTYNLQKNLTPQEKEKLRKMQELEDLISGRRGSTLKFTLTPQGLK